MTLADSNAVKDPQRLLPQHQAALTLLQARLSTPGIRVTRWLDLACGRGQIILDLADNLSREARASIEYWGYDINQAFARETRKTATPLGFASIDINVGDLADFDRILPADAFFDFITLTNTVHEVESIRLAGLLVNCIKRLSETGTLFIYDMDRIKPPELGAVPWTRDDIRRVVRRLLDALGATEYRPEVGLWEHRTCKGWNVQLQRQHLNVKQSDAMARAEKAVGETRDEIFLLLKQRLAECQRTLETLTLCGAETSEEQEAKERLLFEFWAVSRALGRSA